VHEAVAPVDRLVIVTTVPLGRVWWAHVPGGAASYHVAPPVWLVPEGAADADPDGAVPDLGAGLAVDVVGLGAGRVVVVVARRAVVVGVVRALAGNERPLVGTGVVVGVVVDGGAAESARLTRLSTGREAASSGPPLVETARAAATWAGAEDGGGDACSSAITGTPAMAAHSTRGTPRRAFLDPRVVRTFPFLQNAGAARPRLTC
jgi:hypothetical protein